MWGLLAVVALLWPARTSGLLDGLPLEHTIANAVLVGVVVPSLLCFHPRFLRTRLARGAVVALLAWKAVGAAALTPDGWCVRFEPQRPLVADAASIVPHSWDVRADWLADKPVCSAMMRRAYTGLGEFPVWFFNLPPPNDSWPVESDRPPGARTGMTVSGFLDVAHPGVLQFDFTPDMNASAYVDGVKVEDALTVAPGTHRVRVDAMLTGERWRFEPHWNGADLWHSVSVVATAKRPSRLDILARPVGGWVVTALALGLILPWAASMVARIGSPAAIAWMVGASAGLGWLAATGQVVRAQWYVAALAGAALVPVPARLKNVFGAFVLVGVPWLTLIVVVNAGHIGRFLWYTSGDDFWMYQRFGYRIVMQGYWLEGGTKLFYFQPLYRWVSGLLHLLFGDSSVGEFFWDGACFLVTALLAFFLTKASSGFRCGLIAAAATLTVVALGAPWGLIGRGLSEITSAGFICLGAFMALRSRRGSLAWAAAAGVLGSLAFYTRLNNLPMAAAITLFALSARVPVRRFLHPGAWRARIAWRTVVAVPAVLGLGLLLFAWRNWHFNGAFSVFYGTQRNIVALWQPGMSFGALVAKWLDSVLMVLTVHDPPMFDWRSLPVLAGAVVAPLAVLGVPRLRDVPALPALFFLVGISSAFVARGWTYQGRFSVHVIGITCALMVMGIERLLRPVATSDSNV
jgi:Dolichyl-phosphate-mannose-protein mannosyltransferase